MTFDEYKQAKLRSGISVSEIWCGVTEVSRDRDKSFSCGRTAIPSDVATRVNALLDRLVAGASELRSILQSELQNCSVHLDPDRLEIGIEFPTGKVIRLHHGGVDMMNFWQVFKTDTNSQGGAVFLRGRPFHQPSAGSERLRWYLWRGDFAENRNLRRLQNYTNPVEKNLLLEVFSRYV